jgi:hypothetical protein
MHLKTVSFADMNRLVAQQLSALLLPVIGDKLRFQEMIIHLCPHPLMKLVYPKFCPLVRLIV